MFKFSGDVENDIEHFYAEIIFPVINKNFKTAFKTLMTDYQRNKNKYGCFSYIASIQLCCMSCGWDANRTVFLYTGFLSLS